MAMATTETRALTTPAHRIPHWVEFAASAARRNWQLATAVPVLFGLGAVFSAFEKPQQTERSGGIAQERTGSTISRDQSAAVTFDRSLEDGNRMRIDAMLSAVDADQHSAEAPSELQAIAGMYYGQLQDYDAATQIYLRIISDYSDFEYIGDTYLRLAECYRHAGDFENERSVYAEIVARFDSESRAHQIASTALEQP